MKCKSKLYCYVLTPLLCLFLVFTTFTMPTYASTTSGSENLFEYTENYVRDNFNAICRFVVKQNAIISDAIIGTWDNFTSWLVSSGNGDIWVQHPHSPIRTQNGVDNVEVPTEVLNVINEYVIYQIQQNSLTYTECYVHSYNFLTTEPFNYQQYTSLKNFIHEQSNSYVFIARQNSSNYNTMYIYTMPKDVNYAFIGTTTQGVFTNVTMSVNWATTNQPYSFGGKKYSMNQNGVITDVTNNTYVPMNTYGLSNSTGFSSTLTTYTVFTPTEKDELVYVFNTIQAYKNYNAGLPQSYYLTSDGISNSMSNWSVGSGTINTGTLSNANSSYSSVVNNVQSGWTAEEVLQLVNMISNNNGSGPGSGSGSDEDGWLDLGIFGDIGKAIAKILGGIIEAIGTVFTEIISIVTNVSETLLQGTIFDFLSAFIGWLPEEIIALLSALFSVAVLFALIKLIREAF